MTTRYYHKQHGLLIIGICLATAAFWVPVTWYFGEIGLLIVGIVGLILFAHIYSPLTVEVTGTELRWHIGPEIWNNKLPLRKIETVAVVRNRLWDGLMPIIRRLCSYAP
jgi:hypothetical protein